ncbi:MAG TPA: FeoB-associated Cys-rich membrane protein [Polyangiaceae bacterium]|jgi:hypothetical protein|nr:MAG: Virus attachment protein p12 family protein [Deltaproteobacteria bacterium ADurb.Bin207]HNS98936.1 FeoB-associated Cys-rich membrane protein [Polyangiaceae bacterium]HNZ23028.1 FeoB-associated Cys-rich membrane protein [Polyangiaceae bacterium]HOD21195.1 FeoB-associated Cys-rich membrane protein [Polyangiaceae bacterium]HOE49041.1 FeoB-associated Cys-rich membrane protein [Polyangiaceae bacterium]
MDWQSLIVALIVLLAVGYLAWRTVRSFKRPGCGGACDGCSERNQSCSEPSKLVQLRLKNTKKP